MLELVELIPGGQFSICVLRAVGRPHSLAEEYLLSLPKEERLKLWNLLKRVGDFGPPPSDELFKNLKGSGHGLCEFKRKPHRLLGFRVAGVYILTHGFKKKSEATPEEEISRALRLKAEYLEGAER